jgi:hypothetical protein
MGVRVHSRYDAFHHGTLREVIMADSGYAAARERWKECQLISDYARGRGLDATPVKVNRQLKIWRRWYRGGLATGYLMRQTGVKSIQQQEGN